MPTGIFKNPEERAKKISKSLTGKPQPWNIGNTNGFKRGQTPWNKNLTKETDERVMEYVKKGSKSRSGEKSRFWIDGRSRNRNYMNWLKNKRNRLLNSGTIGSHIWGEWETLKAQYDWTCPACGLKEPFENQRCKILTEDHIVPISKGGSDNIENIQPLCQSCNSKKHTKIIKYRVDNKNNNKQKNDTHWKKKSIRNFNRPRWSY